MRKLFTTIVSSLMALSVSAQGWPSGWQGVMLQGFYWDSFSDTQWTNLESQADELSEIFQTDMDTSERQLRLGQLHGIQRPLLV